MFIHPVNIPLLIFWFLNVGLPGQWFAYFFGGKFARFFLCPIPSSKVQRKGWSKNPLVKCDVYPSFLLCHRRNTLEPNEFEAIFWWLHTPTLVLGDLFPVFIFGWGNGHRASLAPFLFITAFESPPIGPHSLPGVILKTPATALTLPMGAEEEANQLDQASF